MKYHFKLKNGLNVLAIRRENLKGIYLIARVKVGHFYDPKGKHGLAHFLEHLLAQGTKNFPTPTLLASFVESLGGYFNLRTSDDCLDVILNLPSNYLPEAIFIVKEILFEPLFNNFQKEKHVILQEMKERKQSLGFKLLSFLKKSIFKKDSLLLYPIYTADERYLNNISEKDIINH